MLKTKRCGLVPRILFVRAGETVQFKNEDPINYAVKVDCITNPPYAPILPPKQNATRVFPRKEILPAVPISCSIHPWIRGYMVIQDHPYGAVSDKDGKLVIKNIPVGTWTFQRERCIVGVLTPTLSLQV